MAQGRSTEIISMSKWIRTGRLSIVNKSLSLRGGDLLGLLHVRVGHGVTLTLTLTLTFTLTLTLTHTLSLTHTHTHTYAHTHTHTQTLTHANTRGGDLLGPLHIRVGRGVALRLLLRVD